VSRWRDDDGDAFEGGAGDDRAPSTRTQRILVRVLLALRGESRRSANPARDARRAEMLADRILADFPTRVLPIGLAPAAIVVLACSFPLLRDALPTANLGAGGTPVARALESGLRTRGEQMSDGIDALRAIMRPFAGSEADAASAHAAEHTPGADAPGSDEAAAPFTKS